MQPLGINITSIKIISEEMAFGNEYGIRKAIKKIIIISLFFSIFASLIFYINSNFIVEKCFHNKVSNSIVYLISIALPMIAISSSISGYFTAVRRIYKSVIANALEYFIKIIATIILLKKYLLTNNVEYICFALILGDVISEIFSFTYNIIMFIFDLEIHIGNNFSKNHNSFIYRIFRIIIPVAFTSYIRSGLSTLKQLMIPTSLEKNGLNCEVALSKYGTITGMIMPIVMFPSTFLYAITGMLIPEFSRYYVKKDYKKVKYYSHKLLIFSFIFGIFLSIFFLIFGNRLTYLIYKDSEIGNYIKIFSFLIPFMYVDIIADSILKGLDAQLNVLFINIFDLLLSVFFIVFLVPIYGINGFIASIFASELLNFILSIRKLSNLQKNLK